MRLATDMVGARSILERSIADWVDDPVSDVVYAEEVEGRFAVRMRQTVREATTVWFMVGQRSLIAEAYVLPALEHPAGAHRLALIRNHQSFRVNFALDSEEALVLRARIPLERVTAEELSYVLAEIYQTIELSFRSLLRENNP
ncbi:MAG TPA: YbjN domain-containing protein [Acidimicrobiia bacterium]|nr:YbjN domain-containing protein [Acidimicrobiia bacterium]